MSRTQYIAMEKTKQDNRNQKRPQDSNPEQILLPFMCLPEKKATKTGKGSGKTA